MKHINKIKIGILGYGNLGKGVELSIKQNPDIEPIAIFTRRSPSELVCKFPVFHISKIKDFIGKIDVMILCGGSSTDLPEQGPEISKYFNTVDSFDTHANIPEYFEKVNRSSRENKTLSLISAGWDPGLFSLIRLLGQAVLPEGETYTFWGKGVSQGHSDALRRVPGVKNGIQYTVPDENLLEKVRSGSNPKLKSSDMHTRVCYVVPEKGADLTEIETRIKTMPHYFKDFNTIVNFISEEELKNKHSGMPHGGTVIRTGSTASSLKHRIEFSVTLQSNPEFTANVMVAYARAVARLSKEGRFGALTIFDIPFGYLSPESPEELRKKLL
ncbi:MAG TPA: diaminopimelate dehydrogenase [Bacteroidales bacterium]|nr:diaminopimelate dehydrogenase [Bacteroidales bacterium]HCI56120.1 diaminopimelate dehydrogenase [Bacteroidales bacterium]HRC89983.1 diaminopimelate dehydrogenase [Bacteroidales bacterium]